MGQVSGTRLSVVPDSGTGDVCERVSKHNARRHRSIEPPVFQRFYLGSTDENRALHLESPAPGILRGIRIFRQFNWLKGRARHRVSSQGRELHPLKSSAFSRRTVSSTVNGCLQKVSST